MHYVFSNIKTDQYFKKEGKAIQIFWNGVHVHVLKNCNGFFIKKYASN